MTGKEAIDKLVHYLVPFHATSTKENAKMINDCLNAFKELEEENTKYKRAFEILKDKFFIDLIERQDDGKLGFEPINPLENQPRFAQLTKEQYELLKEVFESLENT